jgi:pyruvate/2-oxoglutarate/acetoin dehydrogenase E1 component/TPP-dependent pyruvate/acetoin dehydrogenase alpha subunit
MDQLNNLTQAEEEVLTFEDFRNSVLFDYRIACESREASLTGRKEVLTGKAKFGIFGDGKEVPQLAMARVFKNGDFRSGYYRDQTFMLAIGALTLKQFFAQLYAHTDVDKEPASGGRQMNGHYATRNLDNNGNWLNLTSQKNSSADISPTASQMPRLLGLAQASKIYRNVDALPKRNNFSVNGNEIAFGTIGDASTSEGLFWETINAAGVLQVPMLVSVWDDGYGISVTKENQTTKASISEVLAGFQKEESGNGLMIYKTKAWDYAHLIKTYEEASEICRNEHIPALIHVEEVTQPQGHSTSGSHERYKTAERLQWEKDFDCIAKMREWILKTTINDNGISKKLADENELIEIENEAKKAVKEAKSAAWNEYLSEINLFKNEALQWMQLLQVENQHNDFIADLIKSLQNNKEPFKRDIISTFRKIIYFSADSTLKKEANLWLKNRAIKNYNDYSSHLYSQSEYSALNIASVSVKYDTETKWMDGREILRDNFDYIFKNKPEALIFGEDAGRLGDVNQGLEGLQAKYGELRIADTGIREATIIGQGIGMAMRGLRPIAEIQYLDYLLYGLQLMSDDLATVQYRTKGGQKAPLIVRTRGHRLEGIWHSGSPMGTIINALRGLYICVPRNMTEAAGFYNTLLESDDCALVIEPLNGYRLKERKPENIGQFKTPLGVPEILQTGTDVTVVSYGSTLRIIQDAIQLLEKKNISIELIDIRTLLPFDINEIIKDSIKKTNKLVVIDEDVEGGATGFILQQIIDKQGAFPFLDASPLCISAKDHRPAYGSDGDYFSKPNAEDIFEKIYTLMHEYQPKKYPAIF